jgi:hypothetical protein
VEGNSRFVGLSDHWIVRIRGLRGDWGGGSGGGKRIAMEEELGEGRGV